MMAIPQIHEMSIAPLFQKRLSAAVVLAWLIFALAPARTRADECKPSFSFDLRPVVLAPGLFFSRQKSADIKLNNVEESKEIVEARLCGMVKADDQRAMGLYTYGLMFVTHTSLPGIARRATRTAVRPKQAHNLNMQSPSQSDTLTRGGRLSDRSLYPLEGKTDANAHTNTERLPPLSLDKAPILGQFEQVAESLAPILMLIMMSVLAGSSSVD